MFFVIMSDKQKDMKSLNIDTSTMNQISKRAVELCASKLSEEKQGETSIFRELQELQNLSQRKSMQKKI